MYPQKPPVITNLTISLISSNESITTTRGKLVNFGTYLVLRLGGGEVHSL